MPKDRYESVYSMSVLPVLKHWKLAAGVVSNAAILAAALHIVNDPEKTGRTEESEQHTQNDPHRYPSQNPRGKDDLVILEASTPAEPAPMTIDIRDDITLTFDDEESYKRTLSLMHDPEFAQYKGLAIPQDVRNALAMADAMTPYPYEFLVGQAYAESKFDKEADNPDSTALGLMQTLKDTTLEILYDMKSDPAYSFIPERELVTRSFDKAGKAIYSVIPGIRERDVHASVAKDPVKALFIATEFNEKYLAPIEAKYPDRTFTSVDAYTIHWQGPGGARKLLDANPDSKAASLYGASSEIVQSHKSIFYKGSNVKRPRTVEEVFSHLETVRGLGDTPISINAWSQPSAIMAYTGEPSSYLFNSFGFQKTLAPTVSVRPKPRPAHLGTDFVEANIAVPTPRPDDAATKTEDMEKSIRPRPKPQVLNKDM